MGRLAKATGTRSSTVITNAVRPDAHHGSLADPVDGEKVTSPFIERDIENALARIVREDSPDARDVRVHRAVDFEVRAGVRAVRSSAQSADRAA